MNKYKHMALVYLEEGKIDLTGLRGTEIKLVLNYVDSYRKEYSKFYDVKTGKKMLIDCETLEELVDQALKM